MKTFFAPHEVAIYFNVKTRTVYKLIRKKRLKALKIGRLLRIHKVDLDAFVEEERGKVL
jgi:excisionase family DNA binding protein